jgi:hypothetical protein
MGYLSNHVYDLGDIERPPVYATSRGISIRRAYERFSSKDTDTIPQQNSSNITRTIMNWAHRPSSVLIDQGQAANHKNLTISWIPRQ